MQKYVNCCVLYSVSVHMRCDCELNKSATTILRLTLFLSLFVFEMVAMIPDFSPDDFVSSVMDSTDIYVVLRYPLCEYISSFSEVKRVARKFRGHYVYFDSGKKLRL